MDIQSTGIGGYGWSWGHLLGLRIAVVPLYPLLVLPPSFLCPNLFFSSGRQKPDRMRPTAVTSLNLMYLLKGLSPCGVTGGEGFSTGIWGEHFQPIARAQQGPHASPVPMSCACFLCHSCEHGTRFCSNRKWEEVLCSASQWPRVSVPTQSTVTREDFGLYDSIIKGKRPGALTKEVESPAPTCLLRLCKNRKQTSPSARSAGFPLACQRAWRLILDGVLIGRHGLWSTVLTWELKRCHS